MVRPDPRRPIAAGLRRIAALALRTAQVLATDEPEPAQALASGGSEPAQGPPEHWRALVAARAPALLRGEGIGLRRGPAGPVPGVRPVAAPPLGPVTEPGPPVRVSGEPERQRVLGRTDTPPPAAPIGPVVRVRPQPRPALEATPEASGAPASAVPVAPAPRLTAPAIHRPAPRRLAADEPGRVAQAPDPVQALRSVEASHSPERHERRADEDRAATEVWPPLPRQDRPIQTVGRREEPAARTPAGPAAPAVSYPDVPAPAVVPVITVHRHGATPLDPGRSRPVRPRLAEPERPEPDPWPDLPDDSPLWTLPPVAYGAERVRRLAREQAGR